MQPDKDYWQEQGLHAYNYGEQLYDCPTQINQYRAWWEQGWNNARNNAFSSAESVIRSYLLRFWEDMGIFPSSTPDSLRKEIATTIASGVVFVLKKTDSHVNWNKHLMIAYMKRERNLPSLFFMRDALEHFE